MFSLLKQKVETQFLQIAKTKLFTTNIDKDVLFQAYLNTFNEEDRQYHNCRCCRAFLNRYGNVVTIINNKVHTVWDFQIDDPLFSNIPKVLGDLVRSAVIDGVFLTSEKHLGTDFNIHLKDGKTIRWEHFHTELPKTYSLTRYSDIGTINADQTSTRQVFKRSLDEITLDSVETVLELIAQNSLYRGNEHKTVLTNFRTHKIKYDKLSSDDKELYAWENFLNGSKIRNSAIGTLLVDLSDGKELDFAVRSFESMVAPQNYKRPTALVTKAMIQKAEKEIVELGYEKSLYRRHASLVDVTVNNMLFVDRSITESSLFGDLKDNVLVDPRKLSKVEEVSYDTFINDILPTATGIEILFENNKINNLMNVIAPVYEEAPKLFNWNNNISWSYNNDLTDSIKERVKQAGGTVEGELRISLDWFNFDDLDLSVVEPDRNIIYFSNKNSNKTGGFLDVDMNAGSGTSREAVENIIYQDDYKMLPGKYEIWVHNFCKRENVDVGFNVQIECRDQIIDLSQSTAVADGNKIHVATLTYDKNGGIIDFVSNIPESSNIKSKDVWGISTNKFHKVSMIMLSPNYWGDNAKGNKHTFFIIDKSNNDSEIRGLYNEFLKPELLNHKRVFELLGSKLKVGQSKEQLAGLGFSSTQISDVVCKVSGKFTRVIKIKF